MAPLNDTTIVLPDLIGQCVFALETHPSLSQDIGAKSNAWLFAGCPALAAPQRAAIAREQLGSLAAYTWPHTDERRLRILADFVIFLYRLDDIAEALKDITQIGHLVLNAMWFPDRYVPTREQPEHEPSLSALTRSYAIHLTSCHIDAQPLSI